MSAAAGDKGIDDEPYARVPRFAEGEIALPIESVRAIASSARLDILRRLRARPRTLSELVEATGTPKTTMLTHLQDLGRAGFVHRLDDGERLWIRYSLTPLGARLVAKERPTITILLSSAVLMGVVAAALMLWQARSAAKDDGGAADVVASEGSRLLPALSIAAFLLLGCAAALVLAAFVIRRRRGGILI